ncbi:MULTISPECIES: hypothetical protein [Bacillus]|uniref:hypothetical protein n=1 Tax=Bacillus TaxID=1386 RepID=UPI00128BFA5E
MSYTPNHGQKHDSFFYNYKKGRSPRTIFEGCGFGIDVIGLQHVVTSGNEWVLPIKKVTLVE